MTRQCSELRALISFQNERTCLEEEIALLKSKVTHKKKIKQKTSMTFRKI